MPRYLALNVAYDTRDKSFELSGNLRTEDQCELLRLHLIDQQGKYADKRTANEKETYNIQLRWFSHTRIVIESNTGNNNLRDEILLGVLKKLHKDLESKVAEDG